MADRSSAEANLGAGMPQALSSPLPDGLVDALAQDPTEAPDAARIDVRDLGPLAVVTLQRADRLNALDYQAWCQLAAAFDGFRNRQDLRLVILRGAGDRAFAAGADIREFPRQRQTAEVAVRYNEAVAAALSAVMALPLPVIAMLNGLAVGGGCELAAACDVRISARHAKLGIPVGQLGVMLGPVESYAVARVIGPARLKWLLFSGELLSAEQAERIGLVDRVVDQADLVAEVASLARTILRSSPHTMQAAKQVTDMVDRGLTLRDTDVVTRLTVDTYSGSELKRRVSAFLERSAPKRKEG
ncbi:MAG TPA: enoyl-CoA hydratase/isomerase family protein [Actinomycetes bacterium]|jgi:enoyl-CoA hydratase|nr:enoyl-CoA hydratase/isomerase family protein [Actinomycetes bacterium]